MGLPLGYCFVFGARWPFFAPVGPCCQTIQEMAREANDSTGSQGIQASGSIIEVCDSGFHFFLQVVPHPCITQRLASIGQLGR